MDVAALERFHKSVRCIPSDPDYIPGGGLAAYLEQELRPQVYLIGLALFEDRWATRMIASLTPDELRNIRACVRIVVDMMYFSARIQQNQLHTMFGRIVVPSEAAWMFYQILVFLSSVGFDGDDSPSQFGCTPMQRAAAQCDFLLRKCSDMFMLHERMLAPSFLDYPSYDPHHSIDTVFATRRMPDAFPLIRISAAPVVVFDIKKRAEYWSQVEWVVEAAIMALVRAGESVEIITEDDEVVGISRYSVGKLLSNMVSHPPHSPIPADRFKGLGHRAGSGNCAWNDMLPLIDGPCCLEGEWVFSRAVESVLSVSFVIRIGVLRESYSVFKYKLKETRSIAAFLFPPWRVSVLEACSFLQEFEVSDESFHMLSSWTCFMPLEMVVCRVLRPSVYVLQKAVDPDFRGVPGFLDLGDKDLSLLRHSLCKLLELLALISMQRPAFQSYSDIWCHMVDHGNSFPFGLKGIGMLTTIRRMLDKYGFEDGDSVLGSELWRSFLKYGAFVSDPRIPSGAPPPGAFSTEYPEFLSDGRMSPHIPNICIGWVDKPGTIVVDGWNIESRIVEVQRVHYKNVIPFPPDHNTMAAFPYPPQQLFRSPMSVDDATSVVRRFEITRDVFETRQQWEPPIPVSDILQNVVRPSVYLLQHACSPDGTPFEIISWQQPGPNSIWESWNRTFGQEVSYPLPHKARALLSIVQNMMSIFGFHGDDTIHGETLSEQILRLARFTDVTAALGTLPTDYEEYDENGRLATGVDYVILGWVPTVPSDSRVALEKFARSPESR
ncbi:hypothetical protein C8J57DRAFT_1234297 [Mycena rebaudengoi]|nr:hypothetical protein C8J57DRAFT_1234297 [Mycena rebaudengoi]